MDKYRIVKLDNSCGGAWFVQKQFFNNKLVIKLLSLFRLDNWVVLEICVSEESAKKYMEDIRSEKQLTNSRNKVCVIAKYEF